MLAFTDSLELSKWRAILSVHAEEEQHQRDLIDSGDGVIHDPMADTDDESEDVDDDEC